MLPFAAMQRQAGSRDVASPFTSFGALSAIGVALAGGMVWACHVAGCVGMSEGPGAL